MILKDKLPDNRNYEQIRNHYLVEKSIAQRLKSANKEGRMDIYSTMYQELFEKVPDHPRLTRKNPEDLSKRARKFKYSVVKRMLKKSSVVVEFAPGNCRFSFEISRFVRHVYGVDISDQRRNSDINPSNFTLIIYNGFDLSEIEDNSIDIVFSDQLIEHIHPEDVECHFQLVKRILKPGGKYIFRTPHSLTGPHDMSRYFSDEPECFHLKEWKYQEIKKLVKAIRYSKFYTYWSAKGVTVRVPYIYFMVCESMFRFLPRRKFRNVINVFIPTLCGVAEK